MPITTGRIQITKTATPVLSKVGDTITYTIKICNTGSTPLQLVNVIDPLFGGDISSNFRSVLPVGQCDTATLTHVVTSNDTDPLVNTVTANYSTVLAVSDTATVNLFQPSIQVVKNGPAYSKVGDTITYTYTITNTSSADSPNLILDNVTDTINGVSTNITQLAINAGASNIAPGTSVTFTTTRVVTAADTSPLVNTVNVTYHPSGYPNVITGSASHSVTLVRPDFTVVKTCTGIATAGGNATFTSTITNTGNIPLNIVAIDEGQTLMTLLPVGGSVPFSVTIPVPAPQPGQCNGSVTNTITVTATLPAMYQLTNTITKTASATCRVITLGRTRGFWRNNNGNAILDPNNTGNLIPPVTLGGPGRSITINTIALSNTILAGNYCSIQPSPCTNNLSDQLQPNTLNVLLAQTLALYYNINYIQCYSGQLVSNLACSQYLAPAGITNPNATVNDVLAAANALISNTSAAGTATQAQVSAMINLLDCLNRETPTYTPSV